ncbi:Por secretion system C-terminal sorting domain-containing protein, partial [Flaviramulus basaltis]
IATVDTNGLVTGITQGTVTITATTNEGSFTDYTTVTIIFDGSVDDSDNDFEIDFKIYPNPTNSSNNIYITGLNEDSYTVMLFDIIGKLINKENIKFKNKIGEFNIKNLKTGIYIITVGNLNSLYSTKLIVK